ncbi:unnamed protein product [Closterium sp. NIES-53]
MAVSRMAALSLATCSRVASRAAMSALRAPAPALGSLQTAAIAPLKAAGFSAHQMVQRPTWSLTRSFHRSPVVCAELTRSLSRSPSGEFETLEYRLFFQNDNGETGFVNISPHPLPLPPSLHSSLRDMTSPCAQVTASSASYARSPRTRAPRWRAGDGLFNFICAKMEVATDPGLYPLLDAHSPPFPLVPPPYPFSLQLSPWHDIPLRAGDGLFNFICEIPKDTSAKMEVATDEPGTPIKQDVKKGKVRYYPYNIHWNYGMLPQTWEDPSHANPEVDNTMGDNDPVDVVEIGEKQAALGEVYAVKPLAVLAMIDDGELDWKVICIRADDPKADLVNDVEDVEKEFPVSACLSDCLP